jgi:hypothetical protein
MNEAEFVLEVVSKLETMGFQVVERSEVPAEGFYRGFERLPKGKVGGFDLIVAHTRTHKEVGVECKAKLTSGSLMASIGQCLRYSVKNNNRISEAIIAFPKNCDGELLKDARAITERFNLPISLLEV